MTDPAPDAASGGDGAANARGSSWRDKVATETQEIALAQVTAPDAAAGEQGADDMKSKGKNLLAGALSTPSTRGSSWRDKFAAKTKEITLARVTAVDGAEMPDMSTAMQATRRNEKQVQAHKLAAQVRTLKHKYVTEAVAFSCSGSSRKTVSLLLKPRRCGISRKWRLQHSEQSMTADLLRGIVVRQRMYSLPRIIYCKGILQGSCRSGVALCITVMRQT